MFLSKQSKSAVLTWILVDIAFLTIVIVLLIAFMYNGRIFSTSYSSSTFFNAAGSESSEFANMQALPSNRLGMAAQGPEYSVPAIGWVETYCSRRG